MYKQKCLEKEMLVNKISRYFIIDIFGWLC